MKIKLNLVILILFFSGFLFTGYSGNNYKLSGIVVDSATGKGLQGVNVVILSRIENKNIGGTATDEKGNFKVSDIPENCVRAKFSIVGYQTVIVDSVLLESTSRLGLIKLKPAAYEMPELVIKALKPMVEFHVDKQVVNLDQVPSGSGTITEALKHTGLVEVNPQTNAITIRGESVKIQMDGKPYEMPDNMLAQLPSAMADQVEIILSPGAKESAEGGTYILNIISKKSILDSYSGSISFNSSTNSMNYGGVNLSYKRDKLSVFGYAMGGAMDGGSTNSSDRTNYNSESFYNQRSDGEDNFHYSGGNYKLGFDYTFDDKNSVTFYSAFSKFLNTSDGKTSNLIKNKSLETLYGYGNNNSAEYDWESLSLYGFYKRKIDNKGNDLTFDILFTNNNSPSNSNRNLAYSNRNFPEIHRTNKSESSKTLIFKAEYIKPSDIGRFETGYNLTLRDRENNYNAGDFINALNVWQDTLDLSNLFRYKENINALYLTYSNKFGVIELKTGLRVENLNTQGDQVTSKESFSENYFNLFPNMNLAYKFNDLFQLTFNAFRRVRYPNMYYLNPYKEYNGPNSYNSGNPKIQPQFINSFAISLSQFINTYYVYSTGNISYVSSVVNDSVSYSSPINLNSTKLYGVELTLPYYNSPMSPVHLPDFISMLNIQYGYTYRKVDGQYLRENLRYNSTNQWLNVNLSLKLWFELESYISFRYSPKTQDARNINNETKDLYLNFSRSFLDNKLKVFLSVSDLLKSQKYENQTFGTDYTSSSVYIPNKSQNFSIGIRYMFNDYKERRDRNIDDGRDASGKSAF